jgi:uncharacterized membrane protein YeaQ/YmgE (transglycosylase-associated protein family)
LSERAAAAIEDRTASHPCHTGEADKAFLGKLGQQAPGGVLMDQPVSLLGTPNIHFVSLIIIGGLAGWIAGMILGWRHGIFTNILVGIVGSWIGSELAGMAHFAVYGSVKQFLAALVGSILVLAVWRALANR